MLLKQRFKGCLFVTLQNAPLFSRNAQVAAARALLEWEKVSDLELRIS